MSKTYLGVNIDHVAALRQARGTNYPEPVHAATVAELAGADSICVHLREDRRHIQERDVFLLANIVQSRLNLEIAVNQEMVAFACEVQPRSVCLVHESPEEATTEGGLDVASNLERITEAVAMLKESGIAVTLCVDPDKEQVDAAKQTDADSVELYTGHYAEGLDEQESLDELTLITEAADHAAGLGLSVSAGQGLNYHNVEAIAAIDSVTEINIGHAIVARAMFNGFESAIKEMKTLLG